jgi:membrane associated rhomboid family serine protease
MRENTIVDDFKMHVLRSGNTMNHLIAINVAVFVVFGVLWVIMSLFSINPALYNSVTSWLYFPSSPLRFLSRPWTIITYQFMHKNFMHILFNMIMFLFAGRIFREYLGDKKLIAVYVLGGIAGALMFMGAYQLFPMFRQMANYGELLGASASIMAVLVAIGTLLPRYTVSLMFIGPVRLIYIVLFLVAIDFLSIPGLNPGGRLAHLGGDMFGFIYIKSLQNGTDIGGWLNKLLDKLKLAGSASTLLGGRPSKPRIKYYNEAKVEVRKNPKINRISQEEVDTILDKIARSGYDSLTQKEKDVLFRASKEG